MKVQLELTIIIGVRILLADNLLPLPKVEKKKKKNKPLRQQSSD